jgi:hypothetical protein
VSAHVPHLLYLIDVVLSLKKRCSIFSHIMDKGDYMKSIFYNHSKRKKNVQMVQQKGLAHIAQSLAMCANPYLQGS